MHARLVAVSAAASAVLTACAARPAAPLPGYAGAVDDALLGSLAVTRYQSSKAGLSFADYASSCSRLGDVQALLRDGSKAGSSGGGRLGRLVLS